jgi:hypothetical protein
MRSTKAYKAGYEHGKAAGSWVIDGNTTEEQCAAILKGYGEGDSEVMELCPCPLSGEWAGESISELSARYGVNLDDDDRALMFEDGFVEGFWDEVLRACKYQVS